MNSIKSQRQGCEFWGRIRKNEERGICRRIKKEVEVGRKVEAQQWRKGSIGVSHSPIDVGGDMGAQHAQGLDAVPVLQPQCALPRHLRSPDAPTMGTRALPHPLRVPRSPPTTPNRCSFLPATPPSSSPGPTANPSTLGACGVWDDDSAAPTLVQREEAAGLDPLKPHENDLGGEGRDGEGGQLAPSPAGSQPYARSSPSCPQHPPVPPASPPPQTGTSSPTQRRFCAALRFPAGISICGVSALIYSLWKNSGYTWEIKIRFPALRIKQDTPFFFFFVFPLFSEGNSAVSCQ